MTTSGVTTFTMTRDEIIYAAVRKCSAIADGGTLSTTQLSNASQALNAMLKAFQADGMPLWEIKDYTFSLTATRTYNIGVGQTLATPAPLKITQAVMYDATSDIGIPLSIYTRYDYNLLTNVDTTGTPTALEYQPGNQTGIIKVWPEPDTYSIANRSITITYQRPFDDMVAGTDNVDFPQYWLEPIIYGLAVRLAPEYGVPLMNRSDLMKQAELYYMNALSFGTEEGSLFIQPDWSRMR